MNKKYKYLFGPVPSRRLGISLGIDLLPEKICSFNCTYCECGPTEKLTIKRREFVDTKHVINELASFLKDKPSLDFITFSGSGEPTLHSRISKIIKYIKKEYPQYRLCLLTNGSLFYRKSVRKDVLKCDVIIPSLDAALLKDFIKINRPHKNISLKKYIHGLKQLRKEFNGQYIIEIFLAKDVNDSDTELEKLACVISEIKPDLAQINTLHRPGAVNWIKPARLSSMKKLEKLLTRHTIKTEIISYSPKIKKPNTIQHQYNQIYDKILQTVKRRPMTQQEIANAFGIRITEANKYLSVLEATGKLRIIRKNNLLFYIMQ